MKLSLAITVVLSILVCHVNSQSGQCNNDQPTVDAPHKNPWTALSEEETASIDTLLRQRLNLTGNQGKSQDSYAFIITLLAPNKTDVLPFLDDNAKEPARYARATVIFGAGDSYWQDYMVGPLPVTNSTKIAPLSFPFNNGKAGKTKVHPLFYTTLGLQFQEKFGKEIEDITKKLWNTTFAENGLGIRVGIRLWEEDGRTVCWSSITGMTKSNVSIITLLPLGVAVKLDITSRNWEEWEATGWYALGKYYESTDRFREAVFSPDFQAPPPNVDGEWTSTNKRGDALPLDDLPPPVSKSQGSQRFKLDVEQQYISWMDFSFYFSAAQDLGLSLYDIQYKNQRLIYELSLQEAATHYAGTDPFASQATFFDTIEGLGATLIPLVKGYDCPSHATYLNVTLSQGTTTTTKPDAICIFEYDPGFPIRRHSSPTIYTSIAKNIVFTMRTVSTVGNYDFMIEYNFFYDGAIEVSVRASGYISAAYWEDNPEYGFHIHDFLSGSLHDHVLTFKADFDVNGMKNSVQRVEIVPESTEYPWSNGRVHNTMKALRSFVENESSASVNWAGNDAVIYAIVNKDMPNRFGEFPGYRMKRSAGVTHFTIQNSTNYPKGATMATHDFYITKQKDSEPRAADSYNLFAPEDPAIDFLKFLDGESIEQEDVVLWFNLGMHHMAHTGDLPNTLFTSAHSAMRFEPLNYLEGDPSIASNQQVRIDYNADGSVGNVEEFGKQQPTCT